MEMVTSQSQRYRLDLYIESKEPFIETVNKNNHDFSHIF